MKPYAPIAIFVYNRPVHTQTLLQSLLQNPEFSRSPIMIFCDGLRPGHDPDLVETTRKVVRQWVPSHAIIVERDRNWGLAPSVISGVTELVTQYGRVIVFEDDLVASSTALRYLNQALDFYESYENVMHVAAYMFPVSTSLPELFFYQEATCWGWGTWKRAWHHFNPNGAELLAQIQASNRVHEFNVNGTIGFLDMLRGQVEGRIDSWAIRWYASFFLKEGLSLHPAQSLIRNNGFDGTGVHCTPTQQFDVSLHRSVFEDFPQTPKLSLEAVKAMMAYRRRFESRTPWRLRPILRRVKRTLQETVGL